MIQREVWQRIRSTDVTDVTDVTEGRKKEEGRRKREEGSRKRGNEATRQSL
ncbi:hypothetical protein QUB05_05305 [Microcoleus sp. F10-C6]|uniref:hypothetical protein n=1 Tax=unclassified Microcoleus TaxID=2642155 RepID=UPI002FD53952